MKSKEKRTLFLLVILTLMMSLIAACSKTNNSTVEQSKTPGNTEAGTAGKKEERPLYTIKYLYPGSAYKFKTSDETEIGKVIKDKFNIVFEFIPYAGNWSEKVNLMLASKDYPELLWTQYNDDYLKYVNAGALVSLDDYFAKSPDFTKRYEKQIPLWKMLTSDHKVYKWETGQSDYMTNVRTNDMAVRIDLLEEQGWPNLLSTDDWINFLKKAMKNHPTTNGQKSVGITAPFGEPWGMAGISGMLYEKGGRYTGIAGNEGVIFNYDTGKFEDYFLNEYVLETYKFFNVLYREGILDKESFTDRTEQVIEKWNSGRALSAWYLRPGLDTNTKLINAGHPEQQYITMPIRSMTQVKRNEPQLIREDETNPFASFVITKNAKDPKRIFELINWASSEEGQILLQAGIEGKHYTVNNGQRVPTDLYFQEWKNPDSKVGWGLYDFLGNDLRLDPKTKKPFSFNVDWEYKDKLSLTPELQKAVKSLGWQTSADPWKKNSKGAPSGVISTVKIDPGTELGQLHQKMTDFRVKNTPKLIMAKTDQDFDNIWNSLVEEYKKLNPQRVIDKYNDMYKENNDKYKEELSKLK